mmetsp:Transcript_35708/g.57539  ORF Transcript_35708/g.57539 Transcript_35708/m.57539 type:complete len:85 (-) Transcript_35708:12-266(-)
MLITIPGKLLSFMIANVDSPSTERPGPQISNEAVLDSMFVSSSTKMSTAGCWEQGQMLPIASHLADGFRWGELTEPTQNREGRP